MNNTSVPILTQKSGISIMLMLVLIAGIAGNLKMMYSMSANVSLLKGDLTHVVNDTGQIRVQLETLTHETHAEITRLQKEISDLRVKVAEIESK